MKQTPRTRKLNETVREAIALILARRDRRPSSRTRDRDGARVSTDLTVANIYVTAHGDEERYAEVLARASNRPRDVSARFSGSGSSSASLLSCASSSTIGRRRHAYRRGAQGRAAHAAER